jgi:hypothetical protein
VNSNKDTQRLALRLEEALRENRRFRERIELLASQSHHLRERIREKIGPPPEAVAFEEIGSPQRSHNASIPEPEPGGENGDIRRLSESWFPVFENGIAPLDPSPGLRCLTAVRAPIRIGFQLFGLDSDRVAEAVSKVEERQLRERDFIPVFVTDNSDFSIFRSRGYVFEHIPPAIANASSRQRAKRRILKDRLELIKAKWNLRDIVDLSK